MFNTIDGKANGNWGVFAGILAMVLLIVVGYFLVT